MKVENILYGILVTPENSQEKEVLRKYKSEIQKELSMFFEYLVQKEGEKNNEINT